MKSQLYPDKNPMDSLKQELNHILDIIPKGSKIAYLEYPVYGNVGDILIMKGTEVFFSENNMHVIRRHSFHDFPPNIRFPSDSILVFQGGGNLGDLYGRHQEMREYFINRYKKHRIVILPQTIYFRNPENLDRVSQIFRGHPDLHIFTRDKKSFSIARQHFGENVYLTPDMAHFLWPIKVSNSQKSGHLHLLRTDIERCNAVLLNSNSEEHITDWPGLISQWENLVIRIIVEMHRRNRNLHIFPARSLWYILSQHLVNKSINFFAQYSFIKTSRLHGHILACLMNIPNLLLDNSYGKNNMYYETWTFRVPYAKFENRKK
ncbi:MAG: exopolysaccharide biosynthesis protein [Candidatus Methanoperedens sp.]|nr:exopolysaccharide biosynthesis protein [Candidatus Methanoperedens sp.]